MTYEIPDMLFQPDICFDPCPPIQTCCCLDDDFFNICRDINLDILTDF